MKLFVFGTCTRGEAHHGLLARFGAKFLTKAVYPCRSAQVNLGFVPGLVPAAVDVSAVVVGEVYEVSEDGMSAYDRHHGVPALTVRHKVKVFPTEEGVGGVLRAWVHHMADPDSWANRAQTDGNWGKFVNPDKSWRRPGASSHYSDDDWWEDYCRRKAVDEFDAQKGAKTPAAAKSGEIHNDGYTRVVRDALSGLAEGAELTVTTKGGNKVFYTRKDGILRITRYQTPTTCKIFDITKKTSQVEEYGPPRPVSPTPALVEEAPAAEADPDEAICVACADPIWWDDTYGWLDASASPECAHGSVHTPGVFDRRRTENSASYKETRVANETPEGNADTSEAGDAGGHAPVAAEDA